MVIQFPSAEQRALVAAVKALPGAPPPNIEPPDPTVASLVAQLVAAGLSEPVAVTLAAAEPEECARQLEYLPHRQTQNPGGALRRAIESQWAAPQTYRKAQERTASRQAEREQRRAAQAVREAEEAAHRQRQAAEAAFLARWRQLPEDEQRRLRDLALAQCTGEGNPLGELARRRPLAEPPALLLPLLMDLLP